MPPNRFQFLSLLVGEHAIVVDELKNVFAVLLHLREGILIGFAKGAFFNHLGNVHHRHLDGSILESAGDGNSNYGDCGRPPDS